MTTSRPVMDDHENSAESQAIRDIETMLDQTRPRDVVQGVTSGVGYIVKGAVGACGICVLSPVVGATQNRSSLMGSLLGGATGLVTGVVTAANVAAGGVVTGVTQVVRGVVATPTAVLAPVQGKWWNANEGQWVLTDLHQEAEWLSHQPRFDEDILGLSVLPEEERTLTDFPFPDPSSSGGTDNTGNTSNNSSGGGGDPLGGKQVKDRYYYDVLGVDPTATTEMIQRRYMLIGRKFSPQRTNNNPKAQEKWQQISEAYVILINPELREKYDRVGREALFAVEDEDDDDDDDDDDSAQSQVDLSELYSCLYGSEKFTDYIGRLAATTAASVGDEASSTITVGQARLLQKRRVTRLALGLAQRLDAYIDTPNAAQAHWMTTAEFLCNASYGIPLVRVIGKCYSLAACQFLGSLTSGIGMPSIRDWANSQLLALQRRQKKTVSTLTRLTKKMERNSLKQQVVEQLEHSSPSGEEILTQSDLGRRMLCMLWAQTVVDITNTLHETTKMVLFDQSQPPPPTTTTTTSSPAPTSSSSSSPSSSVDVRKKLRAEALRVMGDVWQQVADAATVSTEEWQGQVMLEEIAFYAMLDTIRREELALQAAKKQQQHLPCTASYDDSLRSSSVQSVD